TPAGLRGEVARGVVERLQRDIRCGAAPLDAPEVAHLRALYDGGLRYWDGEFRRLLDALRDLELRDSTVVIVTSDHGEEFQDHGRLEHGSQLYDETLRIPLVVAGRSVPGGRVTELAQEID